MEIRYIKLNHSEKIYGKKNFLYCEMELLEVLKRYQKYKKIRKEGLALKSLLRKTLKEIREEIERLNSTIPQTKKEEFEKLEINRAHKKRKDLEEEIEEIRNRITELI